MDVINPTPERLAQFAALYIEHNFDAVKACKAMGMKPSTAKSNAYLFKRSARVKLADALRAIGLDEVAQAKKLQKLQESLMPKWNAADEDWDHFENGSVQLEATKEINRILDAYPQEKPIHIGDNVTVLFDVRTQPLKPRERTLTVEANRTDNHFPQTPRG